MTKLDSSLITDDESDNETSENAAPISKMTNGNETSVSRVSVKIPEFIPSDPELWFAMIEGSFTSAGITIDNTKFGHVIGALPPKYAVEVKDLIMDPPKDEPYKKLKEALIQRLCSSQEEKTRQLLERAEIGDRKPSQFLRYMQNLADPSIKEPVLKTLWLSRLPRNIQVALAIAKDKPLKELAAHADDIAEASRPTQPQVFESSSEGLETILNLKMSQLALNLQQELSTLRQEISAINDRSSRAHSREDRNFRSRSRSRSQGRPQERASGICWYHWRFGSEAKKCEKPCSFKPGNETGSH